MDDELNRLNVLITKKKNEVAQKKQELKELMLALRKEGDRKERTERYQHGRAQADAYAAVKRLRDNGELPNPLDVPCKHCGHTGKDKRHDHHHPNGYTGENAGNVIVLCASCHTRLHVNKRYARKIANLEKINADMELGTEET